MAKENSKLRGLIAEKFKTKTAFAKFLGVSTTKVSHVVQGKYILDPPEQAQWARALGKHRKTLFGGKR
jgi:plasmid maintenance system antidote protein VapI